MSAFDPKRKSSGPIRCDAPQLQFDVVGCRSRALGKAHETAEIHKNNCGVGRCVAAHGARTAAADAGNRAPQIEIAIFPSGKLRRPKEKLETIARQEVLARMTALSDDGVAV